MKSENSSIVLKISRDFSVVPAGRYLDDGDFNGEKFRENLLIPALQKFNSVVIDFDGAEGYGSSFLEESFGGLVRRGIPNNVIDKLSFISNEDPSLVQEVQGYINDANRDK